MLRIPPKLLAAAFLGIGRADLWERLGRPLVVDPAKLLAAGWHPVNDTWTGLAAMVEAGR